MKSIFLSFFLSALLGANAYAGPVLSAPTTSTSTGQFNINIDITGVSDLYAYQFDISFNPSILAAITVSEGGFLSSAGSTSFVPGTIDNGTGTISFTADSLISAISGANGSGTLAIISFNALQDGVSALNISNTLLLDSNLSDIAATTTSGSVTVSDTATVPEPTSWALMGAALIIGAWTRRNRFKRSI